MNLDLLVNIAYGAVAILVALVAIYFAVKLLGKIAKFVVIAVVVALVLWFVFSNHSIVQSIRGYIDTFRAEGFNFETVKGFFFK